MSSLKNSVLDLWWFYEIKFLNYVRARNTRNVITILWEKIRGRSKTMYGHRWKVKNLCCQKKALLHLTYLYFIPYSIRCKFLVSLIYHFGFHVLFHESRLQNSVLDLPPILFIKRKLHCGCFASLRNSKTFPESWFAVLCIYANLVFIF